MERMKGNRIDVDPSAFAIGDYGRGLEVTNEEAVQAAARVLVGAALDLLQADDHHWSERPCSTCRSVGVILGRPFGCYLFAQRRAAGEKGR